MSYNGGDQSAACRPNAARNVLKCGPPIEGPKISIVMRPEKLQSAAHLVLGCAARGTRSG